MNYRFLFLLLICFYACDDEITEPYTISVPPVAMVKVASIDYVSRSSPANQDVEYTVRYLYEGDQLVEIQNYLNLYNKRYTYNGDQVASRRLFDIAKARDIGIDSFFYNAYGLLEGVARYYVPETAPPDYQMKRLFSYHANGQLAKIEDFEMPESKLLFTREYEWDGENLANMILYYSEPQVLVDIKEEYEYDQANNYQRLFVADPDEPVTLNNLTRMNLTDRLGNFDGIYTVENEMTYNADNLPMQIIRKQFGVNDGAVDTIRINYQ